MASLVDSLTPNLNNWNVIAIPKADISTKSQTNTSKLNREAFLVYVESQLRPKYYQFKERWSKGAATGKQVES